MYGAKQQAGSKFAAFCVHTRMQTILEKQHASNLPAAALQCRWLVGVSQVAVSADGMHVLATLLVIGSMDTARSDILGNGNVKQSPVEQFSQVCCHLQLCW